ncbi:pali-domain-containing protein, partial [Atractiella rhizophila]
MALGNIPGIILLLGATVLLIIASLGLETTKTFYYLDAHISGISGVTGAARLKLGTWSWCVNTGNGNTCSDTGIGYDLKNLFFSGISVLDQKTIQNSVIEGLTKALILVPIGAGLSFLALLFALSTNILLDILASVFSFLAALVTGIAVCFEAAAFVIARDRINDADAANDSATLGNNFWFVIASFIAQFLAMFLVLFGCLKRRRSRSAYPPPA